MKTPREIILEQHRAAEARLDALRENVVATAISSPQRSWKRKFSAIYPVVFTLWRELVLPCRRIWTGVAAVWFVIVVLHLSTGAPPKTAAGRMAASAQDVLMTLREQKEILAELTGPVTSTPVPPPPPAARPAIPGPRGDRRRAFRSV